MKTIDVKSEIYSLTKEMLSCEKDFYFLKKYVERLHEIFYSITAISAFELEDDHIDLNSGKAISPSSAAHCLIEFMRTAVFLRGIYKAINDLKDSTNEKLQILYAGCGPYSTLLLPLLPLFSSKDVGITLVDINEISMNSSIKLLKELDLFDFIDDHFIADLTRFKFEKPYDLVISETMQSCLENEPQVHIMRNLIPQMKKEALFIPEEIRVDFFLSDYIKFSEKILYENRNKKIIDKKLIGNFILLNKENILSNKFEALAKIPSDFGTYKDLILYTFITVYNNEELKERECSLNLAKKFYDFSTSYIPSILFNLNTEGKPFIETKSVE